MALKSWLASLKADVSDVSDVQAPIHAGLGRYVNETADVSGVSGSGDIVAIDTADTAAQNQTYQAQPAWTLGYTGVTGDTCKLIDTEANATNELLSGELLTDWNVTIPPGTTATTLAKFRVASLALDASIVAAGGSLELPSKCSGPSEATISTTVIVAPTDDPKRIFRQREPWLT